MPQGNAWTVILRTMLADVVICFGEGWLQILWEAVVGWYIYAPRGDQHGWDSFYYNIQIRHSCSVSIYFSRNWCYPMFFPVQIVDNIHLRVTYAIWGFSLISYQLQRFV